MYYDQIIYHKIIPSMCEFFILFLVISHIFIKHNMKYEFVFERSSLPGSYSTAIKIA